MRVYSLGFTFLYGRFSAVLLCLAEDVIFGVGFSRVFVKQVWIPLLARREFVALHNVVRIAPLLSSLGGCGACDGPDVFVVLRSYPHEAATS